MAEVAAIICGWKKATVIVRCQRCDLPLIEQDGPLQFCADCREWLRAAKRRGRGAGATGEGERDE